MPGSSLVTQVKSQIVHGKALAGLILSRFAGTFMQFVSQVLAGRLLGADAVGMLGVGQGYILLLGTIVGLGTPRYVLRRTVKRSGRHNVSRDALWLQFAIATTALTCPLVLALFFGLWLSTSGDLSFVATIWLGIAIAAGTLGYAITKLIGEYLKGQGRAGLALSQEFMHPYVVVAIITLVAFFAQPLLGQQFTATVPAAAFAMSFIFIAFIWLRWLRSASPIRLKSKQFIRRLKKGWRELAAITVVVVGNQIMFSVPVTVAFAFSGATVAGYLTIILKLTGLLSSLTAVFASFFAPRVARAHRAKAHRRVILLYIMGGLATGISCAFIAGLLVFFPAFFLGLFGPAFVSAQNVLALQIAASARIVRQFFGLTEVFLTMTGQSHLDVIAQGISIAILLAGIFWLGFASINLDVVNLTIFVAIATTVKPIISSLLFFWLSRRK